MNQIQEKDWAEESWHGHTGIDSNCDYCIVDREVGEIPKDQSDSNTEQNGTSRVIKNTNQKICPE
jgi:hypothetical protein